MEKNSVSIGDKIKEISEYFIDKVVKGEYKLTKSNKHTATILIDDTYSFSMWIGNSKSHYDFYDNSFCSFNAVPISMKHLQSRGWCHMKKYLAEMDRTAERLEKLKQFEKLKVELNIK